MKTESKMKKGLILLMASIFCIYNTINAQQVNGAQFNLSVIQEDFNSEGNVFPVVTTSDNYFILDKGDYLLSRNNQQSEYAILTKSELLEDFSIRTSIRLGPSKNKVASVGVIIKAQQDGKGAIIFEINKKQEYRIKQLVGSTYKTLSGKAKNDGWVKSKLIKGVDDHNAIEIRTENNIYDVVINNSFLTTFFVPDYTNGVCGIIISPETKARISYFYINKKGQAIVSSNTFLNENNAEQKATIERLNKKIKELESNNATLIENNTSMMNSNTSSTNELNKKNADLASISLEQENEIKSLKNTIEQLSKNNDKIEVLESKNTENNALINTLNSELSALKKEKNDLTNQLKSVSAKNTTLVALSTEQEKENAELKNKESELVTNNKSLNDNIAQLNLKVKSQKELQTVLSTDLEAEKTAHNKTKQDLKKAIALNNTKINSAKEEVIALKTKITSLSNSNKTTESALTKEKNARSRESKELHALINKKRKEITSLSAKIDQLNKALSTEKDNSKNAKDCALDVTALAKELSSKNKKLNSLEKTQTEHNNIVAQKNKTIDDLTKQIKSLEGGIEVLKVKTGNQQKTNEELKQLFVYKDFEVNGVKPSEILNSTEKTYPTPKELNNPRQIYAVQFGVFLQVQPYASLKRLDDVWYETTEHGTYVYLSGQFTSPTEATAHKNTLIKLGYPNAFVVQLSK